MKRSIITALALASLLTVACSKDKPAPSTEQLLSANAWRTTALTASPGIRASNGTIVTNIFPSLPDCTKDDTQQFVAGGQFKADEGATKCDPGDAQTVTGTWTFVKTGNDNGVNVVVNGNQLRFKILSVSADQLQVSTTDDIFGIGTGTSVTYTLTYTK